MTTPVNITTNAESGLPYSVNSSGAANQDSALIQAGQTWVRGLALFNTTATARYVKLYNKATAPVSTDTPAYRIYVPPTGQVAPPLTEDVVFPLGLGIRITTGAADSDTGACSANDVLANVNYGS